MRNKYVIVSEKISVVEEEFTVVDPHSLICKPIYVYIGPIEKKLLDYVYSSRKPVIPGSSGVVKVIEDPSGKRGDLSGKIAIVKPAGRHGLLSLDRNGLLAHYASIPVDYIWGFVSQPKPFQAISPLVSHALNLVKTGEDPSLILGCDIIGIAAALLFGKMGREKPVVVCENPSKIGKKLGLEIYETINATSKFYSTIYVTDGSFSFIHDSLQELNYRHLVISPYSLIKYIPLKREFEVRIVSTFDDKPIDEGLVKSTSSVLMKTLDYVEVKDVDEATLLLPPRDLGVVLGIKRFKEDSTSSLVNEHS